MSSFKEISTHRARRLPAFLFLLAATGLMLSACTDMADEASTGKFRVPVTVEEVTKGRIEKTIKATGSLRAFKDVQLTATSGGYLQLGWLNGARLKEGVDVASGFEIATLISEESRVNQTAGKEAKWQELQTAEAELARFGREVRHQPSVGRATNRCPASWTQTSA